MHVAFDKLGPLHLGRLDGQLLVSNDAGHWALLGEADAAAFLGGEIAAGHPRHEELARKGFLREGLDVEGYVARVRRRKAPVFQGTHLHLFVVTLRCDHACTYCHASRVPLHATGADMSIDTARQAVDVAFQTASPVVNVELQGGEPLANAETVRFIVEYAREANRFHRKQLLFSLVTNLSRMTEEMLDWLVAEDIAICTSVDGPRDLHDANRRLLGDGSSFDTVRHWLGRIREAYAARGLDPARFHVEALMTTTRASLGRAKDLVDAYVELGLPSLHVRPLNPYGFAAAAWERIGYTTDEFLAFWLEVLDDVLARVRAGADLREHTASVFLTKLLTGEDPGHLDIRSPCGAGIGQLAYGHDGRVYTCDEGRMLARTGDATFELGDVAHARWRDLVAHPTVRTMTLASLLESLPGCRDCVYQPYCGVCPVYTWSTERDLFGQRPRSERCRLFRGQIEGLLRRLRDDPDGATERVFRRWTVNRGRVAPACAT
ncbi:MAG: His-Xaa-Ser system radical SAM maturase HxsB [Myxococcota bacterium]